MIFEADQRNSGLFFFGIVFLSLAYERVINPILGFNIGSHAKNDNRKYIRKRGAILLSRFLESSWSSFWRPAKAMCHMMAESMDNAMDSIFGITTSSFEKEGRW